MVTTRMNIEWIKNYFFLEGIWIVYYSQKWRRNNNKKKIRNDDNQWGNM